MSDIELKDLAIGQVVTVESCTAMLDIMTGDGQHCVLMRDPIIVRNGVNYPFVSGNYLFDEDAVLTVYDNEVFGMFEVPSDFTFNFEKGFGPYNGEVFGQIRKLFKGVTLSDNDCRRIISPFGWEVTTYKDTPIANLFKDCIVKLFDCYTGSWNGAKETKDQLVDILSYIYGYNSAMYLAEIVMHGGHDAKVQVDNIEHISGYSFFIDGINVDNMIPRIVAKQSSSGSALSRLSS